MSRLGIRIFATAVMTSGCGDSTVDQTQTSSGGSVTSEAPTETQITGTEPLTMGPATSSTTSDAFDIAEWVGDYHEPPPFATLGVDWSPGADTEYFRNLYIRSDFTATLTLEPCSPTMDSYSKHYRVDPAGPASFQLEPSEPGLYIRIERGGDCNSLAWESASGPENAPHVVKSQFHRGAACWMVECEAPEYRVYPDYCSGEPPPDCP